MTATLNRIIQESEELSNSEKAQLALKLITSIEGNEVPSDHDDAWKTELDRREAMIKTGEAQWHDWADVKKEILEN